MKATELRIGNYVNYQDELTKVISLREGDKFNENIGLKILPTLGFFSEEEIKPIPLTEEWLLKFGFKRNGNDDEYFYYTKDNFTMLKDYGSQGIAIPTKENKKGYVHLYCGYYDNEIDFKHVHQLQNIYFALTGEELKIKELISNGIL